MKLSNLFSDGAVLQRGMPVPVWGTTEPDSVVRITCAGVTAFGASSSAGDFLVRLPELPVGGPYELVAETVSHGERIVVRDVMVGEVWLASGQSNMEFTLASSPDQFREFCALNVDPSSLRMITVPKSVSSAQQKDFKAEWKYAANGNIGVFSAVALWFAYCLREKLNVPVGIVHSSWGGTFAEAWTSRSTLMRNPEIRDSLLEYESLLPGAQCWKKADFFKQASYSRLDFFQRYGKADPGNTGLGKGWAEKVFDDSSWKNFQVPGNWMTQGIAGNGVIWARFSVEIPESWSGQTLHLKLGGIDKQDITYFNGHEVGRSGEGFDDTFWNCPRDYTVPTELVKPGRAVIAVRAYSFLYDGAINGLPEMFSLFPEGREAEGIPLFGCWKAIAEVDYGNLLYPLNGEVASQGPGNPNTCSILFDGMIRPLIPYAMRGAIWYQGETNAHSIADSVAYGRIMSDLIDDWRFHWGQGDFPFYLVQLANFRNPAEYDEASTWAPLRESQRFACGKMPNTAMAVAIDCGDALDIHPKDKRTVGERLAAQALYNTYHCCDVVPCGPLPREIRRENGGLCILFDHADGGLEFCGAKDGFFLAGGDGVFRKAESVEADGSSLFLRSAEVAYPVCVRYNWADNPVGTLYNGAGFPASPFEMK